MPELDEIQEDEMHPDTGDFPEEKDCLNQNELVFLLNMIDQLSKRGSFHPSEFIDVGLVYNRIKSLHQKPCKNC